MWIKDVWFRMCRTIAQYKLTVNLIPVSLNYTQITDKNEFVGVNK